MTTRGTTVLAGLAIVLSAIILSAIILSAIIFLTTGDAASPDRGRESRPEGTIPNRSTPAEVPAEPRQRIDRIEIDSGPDRSARVGPIISVEPEVGGLLGFRDERIVKAQYTFDNVVSKKQERFKTYDSVTAHDLMSLAKFEALAQLTREDRFYYLGPPDRRPDLINNESVKQFSTTINGLCMAFEVHRSEFPRVFGDDMPLGVGRIPSFAERRTNSANVGVTPLRRSGK